MRDTAPDPSGTPGRAPQGPPPPGSAPPWFPLPAARNPPAAAPVLALVGLAVLVTGLFVLPLNGYDFPGSGVGYVETRSTVDVVSDGRADGLYSGPATFWWLWGVLATCALLAVLLCLAVARVVPVAIGLLLVVVSLVGGVTHGVAMAQSVDYQSVQRLMRSDDVNFYDHPGAGVWVSLAGFVLVLAGGVVIAATGRPGGPRALGADPMRQQIR